MHKNHAVEDKLIGFQNVQLRYYDLLCKWYNRNLPLMYCWLLSGVPDYFDRNKISSGGDLSHYASASLY